MSIALHTGDCRAVLATLPDASVHCCVTSPPYWGLRDYGTATWEGGDPACEHIGPPMRTNNKPTNGSATFHGGTQRANESVGRQCHCGAIRIDAQLGLEPDFNAYVASMVAVFREVRRVLRDEGTLWLNLGDSYSADHAQRRTRTENYGIRQGIPGSRHRDHLGTPIGLKPKDLCGIPWRVAFALQADGWYLRQDIIWSKPNPMPESVTDRCTKAHEFLFLFAKGQWKSRVIQFSNLAGEHVHFGRYIGSEEPSFREPVTKFCVRLATAFFNGAQRKSNFSLPPFYAQEWKQLLNGGCRELIGDHPSITCLAAISARFLSSDTTTKEFLQELNSFWLNLSASDALLISPILSAFGAPFIQIDADGTITINDTGEIGKIEIVHNRIVISSTTTCKYYYDAEAIAEAALQPPGDIKLATGRFSQHKQAAIFQNQSSTSSLGANHGATTRNKRSVWEVTTQPFSEAHFATFPPALIEPCIKAGTSEKGCCGRCGKPWVRQTTQGELQGPGFENYVLPKAQAAAGTNIKGRSEGWYPNHSKPRTTTGWSPSCACNEIACSVCGFVLNSSHEAKSTSKDHVVLSEDVSDQGLCPCCGGRLVKRPPPTQPAQILDPFAGAGTTGLVADRLQRNAILIELNPAYAAMSENRIKDDAPLFVEMAP